MVGEPNSPLAIRGDYQSFLTGADEIGCLYMTWIMVSGRAALADSAHQ